jgi:hypothetical protein
LSGTAYAFSLLYLCGPSWTVSLKFSSSVTLQPAQARLMSNHFDEKSNNPFLPVTPVAAGPHNPSTRNRAGPTSVLTQQQLYMPPSGPPPGVLGAQLDPPSYEYISSTGTNVKDPRSTTPVNMQGAYPSLARHGGPSSQSMVMAPTLDVHAALPQAGYSEPFLQPALHQQYITSSHDSPLPRTPAVAQPRELFSLNRSTHPPNTAQPPSFSRTAPPHLPYNLFPPMCLVANGNHLNTGFPLLSPPSVLQPHPFVTHDVNEEDWTR